MRSTPTTLIALAAVAAGVVTFAAPASAVHEQIEVTGLTTKDRLVTFLAGDPGTILSSTSIRGLRGELLGIDYRPATGELFGVVRGSHRTASLVVIDDTTGHVVSSVTLVDVDGAPIRLSGDVGVDFNPVVDALRIVSDKGQNLRVLPSDRATGAAGTTFVDTEISPAGAKVTAVAYTNSDVDPATETELYDLSAAGDSLQLQSPPNDGLLTTVGRLGLRVGDDAGFDIYTEGSSDVALVSLVDRGRSTISVVDLTTGKVNPASTMRIGGRDVVDIAVPTDQ